MNKKLEYDKLINTSISIEYENYILEVFPKNHIAGFDITSVKKSKNKINRIIAIGRNLVTFIDEQKWKVQD